jgi:hypothetical protein
MAMPLAAAPYRASGLVLWHETDLTQFMMMSGMEGKADLTVARPDFSVLTLS